MRATGLACAWHTSHSHATGSPSLRLVFPLSRPVTADRWREFYHAAASSLGIPYERKCANPGRFWYLPSAAPDAEPESGIFSGQPIDVDAIDTTSEPERFTAEYRDPDTSIESSMPAPPEVLERVARFLADHGPAIEGQGGDAHTYRACAIARVDFALSVDESMAVLVPWNATCVPPWPLSDLREKIEHADRYAQNERGAARRAFEEQQEYLAPLGSWAADLIRARKVVAEYLGATTDVSSGAMFEPARVLFSRPYPDTPWLVRGLVLEGGIAVVATEPKAAKTWAATEIALSVALGDDAFGAFPSKLGRVAYFYAEDLAQSIRNRLRAFLAARGKTEQDLGNFFAQPRGRDLDICNDENLAALIASVWQCGSVALLVLDPLRDIHSGEEDKSDAMSKVMRRLRLLSHVLGCTVLMVHHSAKSTADTGKRRQGQKMRGSSAIHGSIDSGIYFSDLKTDGSTEFRNVVLSEVKGARSAGFFELTLTIRDGADGTAEHAAWTRSDLSETRNADDAQKIKGLGAMIIDKLRTVGPMQKTELIESKLGGRAIVVETLELLRQDGRVNKVYLPHPVTKKLREMYQIEPQAVPTVAPRDPTSVADRFLADEPEPE